MRERLKVDVQLKDERLEVGSSQSLIRPGGIKDVVYYSKGFQDQKAIIITIRSWNSLRERVKKVFKNGWNTIIYQMAHGIGSDLGETIMKQFADHDSRCANFVKALDVLGWGQVKFENSDHKNGTGKIVLVNSPFKNVYADEKGDTYHEIRGIIAGFLEYIYQREVVVKVNSSTQRKGACCTFFFE